MSENKGFNVIHAADINGKHTEFLIHRFVDKFLILITQFEKIANFYEVRFDVNNAFLAGSGILSEQMTPLSIIHRFGGDSDETQAAIRFIVSKTKLIKSPVNLLISLAIGSDIPVAKTLREICSVIDEIL